MELQGYDIWVIGIPEGKTGEKGVEVIFETVMTDNYPKCQTTYPGSLENNKQCKCQKTSPSYICLKLQKIKDKEKVLKEKKLGRGYLTIERNITIISEVSSESMQRR